jgi:trehalose 6-phosphate synthase
VNNRIGFFLHIPFPTPEIFTALPPHEELLEALCDYDLLGFQTENDRLAFLDSVSGKARLVTKGGKPIRRGENVPHRGVSNRD